MKIERDGTRITRFVNTPNRADSVPSKHSWKALTDSIEQALADIDQPFKFGTTDKIEQEFRRHGLGAQHDVPGFPEALRVTTYDPVYDVLSHRIDLIVMPIES